ncbi:hypothetical protein GCM10008983_10120 [Lentibacillus halophilus]|uniref:MaoC like domain-containing protein n=1 Tax=Lentibacillus halophilus TaxID=295065 RepID=A0ABN0Z6K3_9BACI
MNESREVVMTAEWVRQYAQSIDAPLTQVNGNYIAPPTMIMLFWQLFDSWKQEGRVLLHVKQTYDYVCPITTDMTLDCTLTLQKQRKVGSDEYKVYLLTCFYQNEVIATAKTTLMIQGE